MKKNAIATFVFSFILLCGGVLHAETPSERDQRMNWWRDARFGMFIHWGLYSVPAGVWKGKDVPTIASWTPHAMSIPTAEWEELIKQFNPTKYNPRDWAKLAKAAGMKYAVLTTKHHEGFCLFDSKMGDFTAMHAPANRDLVKEWLDAFRAEGIRVGFYYSLIDWHHPDYPVAGDGLHPERAKPETCAQPRDLNKYLDYMHGQVRELMTNYGKIDILWFDFSYGKMTGETWRATELMKMVRTLQPGIIVNNRIAVTGPDGTNSFADFATPEQHIPPSGLPGTDWETCMTMNDTWGFKSKDHNWKSTETLIRMLIDIASKGGNYLLNVGPTAEGVIPEASVDRLTEIGRWMQVNGESIYGTSASPFAKQLPWGRCTQKKLPDGKTRLYLHVFDWPKDGKLVVPGLSNEVAAAFLLADPKQTALKCEVGESHVAISVPAEPSDAYASVVVLDVVGEPKIVPYSIAAGADGVFSLHARDAEIHGSVARYDAQAGRESIGYWINVSDWISWPIKVTKPGKYRVQVVYGCAPGSGGGEYVVEIGDQKLTAKARETGGWFTRVTDQVGEVDIAAPGRQSVAIRLKSKPGEAVMDLQALMLLPMAASN